MRRAVLLILAAVWLFAGSGARGQAPGPEEQKIITNYWRHVLMLIQTQEAKPIRPPKMELRYPPPKHYPFAALSHLDADDLVRAAQEGAKYARKRNKRKPADEVARQVRANVRVAFEYYPVLAVSDKDKENLLRAMERETEDPVLRTYVLESAFGHVPQSQFAAYAQEVADEYHHEVSKLLTRIIMVAHEPPQVQVAAMEARYTQAYRAYQEILRRDPDVVHWEQETGKTATPEMMVAEAPPFDLQRSTRLVLKRRSAEFDRLIADISTNFERRAPEALPVKQKGYEIIQRIVETGPLQNPDRAQALLEEHAALAEEETPAAS